MFRSLLCFAAIFGHSWQVTLPNGHDMKVFIDQQFAGLDTNHNGILEYSELAAFGQAEDADHDDKVSLAEFVTFLRVPLDIAEPIFNVYDQDKNGFIEKGFLNQYYHMLDHNNDQQITLQEYELYLTTFLACLFGADHGNHGHDSNCDH